MSAICSSCAHHIRALRHIRALLDQKCENAIACNSVDKRLDYCNSILAGISAHNIARLQRVQNYADRVVCRAGRHNSASVLLQRLHWLPIEQRIQFKVALLCVIWCATTHERYDICIPPTATLVIPTKNNSALAGRDFQKFALQLWNTAFEP
jgi:hypothetical protein